jgi:ubiquinone/menaquinone biosynthesis C-methylase UbiE
VGPNGRVYAEDIQEPMIDAIRRRVQREGLTNVELILGASSDPRLPRDLRAVLIVDAYPEFEDPVALLRLAAMSLAPTGRLGIVDFRSDGDGGPGPPLAERVSEEIVIRDATAAGLKLLSRATFLRYQYMLVFGR